jgi:predicted RNA-binding protein with PUA-like domain
MNYWLFKSEPDEFSIDMLKKVKREPWSGVRNYQARNYMRDGMQVGDLAFFYHSSCDVPGIVGICSIVAKAHVDASQFDPKSDYYDPASKPDDPRWLCVDVGFKRKLKRALTLGELQQHADALGDFALMKRGNRLSVMPVTKAQWDYIVALE